LVGDATSEDDILLLFPMTGVAGALPFDDEFVSEPGSLGFTLLDLSLDLSSFISTAPGLLFSRLSFLIALSSLGFLQKRVQKF